MKTDEIVRETISQQSDAALYDKLQSEKLDYSKQGVGFRIPFFSQDKQKVVGPHQAMPAGRAPQFTAGSGTIESGGTMSGTGSKQQGTNSGQVVSLTGQRGRGVPVSLDSVAAPAAPGRQLAPATCPSGWGT